MMALWDRFALWTCRAWGWHKVGAYEGFDGASVHAVCARCGFRGMIDSQGNLF